MIREVLGRCYHTYGYKRSVLSSWANISPGSVISAHLVPTKKKRKQKGGKFTNQSKKGYFVILKSKTKYITTSSAPMMMKNKYVFFIPILGIYAFANTWIIQGTLKKYVSPPIPKLVI